MAKVTTPVSGTSDLDGLGWIGHIVPAGLGCMALIAAFFAQRSHIQPTLTVSLVVVGALLVGLAYASSVLRSRAAWSFLISLSIVLGVMTLFGAPKIRTLVGIPMGLALVIPLAFLAIVTMLGSMGHRYKN